MVVYRNGTFQPRIVEHLWRSLLTSKRSNISLTSEKSFEFTFNSNDCLTVMVLCAAEFRKRYQNSFYDNEIHFLTYFFNSMEKQLENIFEF